jgi:hypothetical protein
MENVGLVLGIFGFMLGAFALQRITVLENKLKEAGVIDKKFDSKE